MPLESLIARLEREADAEVAAVRERARVERGALTAEAARITAEQDQAELAARRARRRAALDAELASARQQARRAELLARHALLDRIRTRADALLASSAFELQAGELAASLLDDALRFSGGAPARVRARAAIAGPLRASPRGDLEVLEDATAPLGVLLESRDGRLAIDATLAGHLRRRWPQLAQVLLAEVER